MTEKTAINQQSSGRAEKRWAIDKGGTQLDCMLIDHESGGVDVEISSYGQWSSAHRCESREAAIAEADALKAKMLREGGLLR